MLSLLQIGLNKFPNALVLQDEISALFDLQLAIISEEKVEHIKAGIEQFIMPEKRQAVFECAREGTLFDADTISWMFKDALLKPRRVNDNFFIDFSGDSPAFQILRTRHEYRVIETIFIIEAVRQFELEFQQPTVLFPLPHTFSPRMRIAVSKISDWNGYIIAGPCHIEDYGTREMANRKSALFQGVYQIAGQFLETHELARIKRYSLLRSILTEGDLMTRLSEIDNSLTSLSRFSVDFYRMELTLFRDVLRVVIALARTQGNYSHDSEHIYRDVFPIYKGDITRGRKPTEKIKKCVSLCATLRESTWCGQLKLVDSEKVEPDSRPVEITSNISRFCDSGYTKLSDLRLEKLLVLSGWLIDQVGSKGRVWERDAIFQPAKKSQASKGDDSALVEKITCYWLWKILRCDLVCYYHLDHGTDSLVGTGYYTNNDRSEDWIKDQFVLVKELADNDQRVRSILYDACRTPNPWPAFHGTEAGSEPLSDPEIPYLVDAGLESPRSTFILPITHGERTFGIINCVSFRSFAFDEHSGILLREFADILSGHYLAQARTTMIQRIREAMTIERWKQKSSRRFDALAKDIATYFLSGSASIWMIDPYDQFSMRIVGSHNRQDGLNKESNLPISRYSLTDRISVSAEAFREKILWKHGKLGQGQFSDNWRNKPHREEIIDSKRKYIAIIPILDSEQRPLASVTLTSRHTPYTSDWEAEVAIFTRVLAAALNDMSFVERIRDGLSDSVHEIGNIASFLDNATTKFEEFAKDLTSSNYTLQIYLEDYSAFTEDLKRIAEALTPEAFIAIFEDPTFRGSPLVRRLVDAVKIENINLKKLWNRQIENFRGSIRKRKISFRASWSTDIGTVPVDRTNTEVILRNILSNAVKYSPRNSYIEVKVRPGRKLTTNVVLEICNYGPKLSEDEEDRLFQRRFRGLGASNMSESGRGEGLFQALALMEAQHGTISHSQHDEKVVSESYVWHCFRLTFPNTKN